MSASNSVMSAMPPIPGRNPTVNPIPTLTSRQNRCRFENGREDVDGCFDHHFPLVGVGISSRRPNATRPSGLVPQPSPVSEAAGY